MWTTQPTSVIGSTYKCKPFKSSSEEQLELVDDLSWLDITKFEGFEQEVEDIFKMNLLMDEVRIKFIVKQMKLRIAKVIERKKQLEK